MEREGERERISKLLLINCLTQTECWATNWLRSQSWQKYKTLNLKSTFMCQPLFVIKTTCWHWVISWFIWNKHAENYGKQIEPQKSVKARHSFQDNPCHRLQAAVLKSASVVEVLVLKRKLHHSDGIRTGANAYFYPRDWKTWISLLVQWENAL